MKELQDKISAYKYSSEAGHITMFCRDKSEYWNYKLI